MPQTGSDMPYGHLIAATVMTLGICQGYSLTASFLARDLVHTSRAVLLAGETLRAMLASARLSCFYTDKRVVRSLCHSRASCLANSVINLTAPF